MTIKLCFESCLIEVNKVLSPALLLSDFNYLLNKAIQKYFNKRYAQFEVNQQVTDDLRVLVKTAKLLPDSSYREDLMGTSYKVILPSDYVHILNCICEFKNMQIKCAEDCAIIRLGANKLDSNQWSLVITNFYMRPSIKLPYYYISNITDPTSNSDYSVTKTVGNRYGNSLLPVMEIKCGTLDPNKYQLDCVYVDYLRAPEYVELTQNELDNPIDDTRIMEFPDYVIYEIINELVMSMLENGKDPRTLSFTAVNTSVPPIAR